MSQQIYAKIKRSSKYAHQNKTASEGHWGCPFEVEIYAIDDAYCVSGGPGGRYRLADLNLFIKDDGREVRIA
ncbi:MAG: hypothetical protein WCT35_04750 [Sideroxydans sp.]|jgi:hypothetical protein